MMSRYRNSASTNQSGFTLVELAIVMIIIGLLIGGVLKGQQLIENARFKRFFASVNSAEVAVSTFIEKYDAFPGDMVGAAARIPDCAGICAPVPGAGIVLGNGRLESNPGAAPTAEALAFWEQLDAIDLIENYVGGAGTLESVFDGVFFQIGFSDGTAADFPESESVANMRAGHYLVVTATPGAAVTGASVAMLPERAARIDRFFDDGEPWLGNIRAFEGGANGCDNNDNQYDEHEGSLECGLYMRIQQ